MHAASVYTFGVIAVKAKGKLREILGLNEQMSVRNVGENHARALVYNVVPGVGCSIMAALCKLWMLFFLTLFTQTTNVEAVQMAVACCFRQRMQMFGYRESSMRRRAVDLFSLFLSFVFEAR